MIQIKVKFFQLVAPFYEYVHFFGVSNFLSFVDKREFFRKDDVVLDLAGGTGRIAIKIVDKIKTVVIVDASQKMLKECKKKVGIKCCYGYAEKIPFPEKYFDKIIIIDALHHFQDLSSVLLELRRVLKDGGQIIVEEVTPKSIFGKFLILAERILFMKSHFYSQNELKNIFEKYFETKIVKTNKSSYLLVAKLICLKNKNTT